MKKLSIFLISFSVLIAGVIIFLLSRGYISLGVGKKVVVGPKWVNQAQFAGMFLAKDKYIYAKHGLSVSFKEFDSNTDQIDDLLNEKTDFALVSAEELLLARSEGKPVKAVAAIYQVSPYAIVSLSSEKIKNPANFEGKILGVKGGKVEEELFYKLLLAQVGVSENKVTLKNLGFVQTELEDLKSNAADAIDVYRTDQLYFFDKEGINYNTILPEQYGINIFNDVIITREDLIQKKPKLVRAFVAATVEGWETAFRNQDRAVKSTLKFVTNESYKDEAYEKFILEKSAPLIKPSTNTRIGSMSLYDWNKLYQNLVSNGAIKNDFNIEDAFTSEYVP